MTKKCSPFPYRGEVSSSAEDRRRGEVSSSAEDCLINSWTDYSLPRMRPILRG